MSSRRTLGKRAIVLLAVVAVAAAGLHLLSPVRSGQSPSTAISSAEPVLRPPGRVSRAGPRWVARFVASPSDVMAGDQRWKSDSGIAQGGGYYSSAAYIAGTSAPDLFRKQRYNLGGYRIPVPRAGTYRVTYQTAELYWSLPGERAFDVLLEGKVVAPRLDVVKAVGTRQALSRVFSTSVNDGMLDLTFRRVVDQPTVTSIAVELVRARTSASAASNVPAPPPAVTGNGIDDGQMPRGGLFGPNSFWKQHVDRAPISPNSRAYANDLAGQVASRYGGVAAFNVSTYNTAYISAGPSVKRYDVAFDDCQKKGYTPRGLTGPEGQFTAVPIPPQAAPSVGRDASLSIYQASTDTLWTFWRFSRKGNGFQACWGGRLDRVSSSMGIYEGGFGTSASGLAFEGGTIGIKDARAGVIPHAIAFGAPQMAHWSQVSWPAVRSDGGGSGPIPMGTRFRLDPSVDIDKLKLHPLARMVAKAAQDYGMILSETSGAVAVGTESGAETKRRTGTDPWPAMLGGTPSYAVMKGFPWDRLQALPRDYGKPGS